MRRWSSSLGTLFGISGICNILGAIKTAKYYGFGNGDVIVTIAPTRWIAITR